MQPGFRRVAGASAANGDRDAEEMRLTTANTYYGHLDADDALAGREPYARHPQELLASGGGDLGDGVPQRQDAAREERLRLLPRPEAAEGPGAARRRARVDALRMVAGECVLYLCTGVRVHVHMPCVCLLGVAIEAAPSGLGRGEPLRRREVVLLVVARLWGDKQRVSSTALGSARTRAAVRGGVRARASSPPPVRLPRISKATRPLFGRSTRYLIRGRGTPRDTYRLGLGSGVRG